MSNQNNQSGFTHEKVETNSFLMIVLIIITVAFWRPGGNRTALFPKNYYRAN
jgi:hypothetical protein